MIARTAATPSERHQRGSAGPPARLTRMIVALLAYSRAIALIARGELGFPIADRLIAEYDAAEEEHLRQVSQAEFVAQTPKHHEGDDVGRISGQVRQAAAAFVELFAASAAAEAAIALRGALRPLRNSRRAAIHTPHPRLSCQRQPTAAQLRKTRSDLRER